MKLELGKRYVTREGIITKPIAKSSGLWPGYDFSATITGVTYDFNESGLRINLKESPEDLVSEYVSEEQKPTLTLPLVVGKKYITKDGSVLKANSIYEHTETKEDIYCSGADFSGGFWRPVADAVFGGYYNINTGRYNGEESKNDSFGGHIVADFVESKAVKVAPKAKEKKAPIRWNNLTFIQAWELARDTKKRYRLKGNDWLVFPQIKINKEMFQQKEWEVERD
tara:strand:- start:1113 stop:1787 length:675 start_codon:yes stop_codon:yes gene_type:complete